MVKMDALSITQAFEKDYEAGQEIRDQANEDMRFVTVSGGMWEGFLEEAFADKPRMEIDLLEESVDNFISEWEENELIPTMNAEEDEDEKDAELLSGLLRADWHRNGGAMAAKVAVYEAVATGFGAIRLGTSYLDDEDIENDRQKCEFFPQHSAYSTVVWDRSATKIDKSDAKWCSVLVGYTKEDFKEKWPNHEPSSNGIDDRASFSWSTKELCYVIEHYRKVEKKRRVNVFINEQGSRLYVEDKDLESEQEELVNKGYRSIKSKQVKSCHIEKSIISGGQFLERPRKIAGKIIPIIPIYAKFNVVDGVEVYRGVIRKEKDSSRLLNMQVSALAETAATSIKEVPIFAPEQIQGLERRWSEAHLGRKNYQVAKPLYDKKGNLVSTGPSGYVKPPQIDPAMKGLIEFTTQHLAKKTNALPMDIEDPHSSGKALIAAQKRVDKKTYSIMGNIVEAMRRLGECYISMAQDIYSDTRKVVIKKRDGSSARIAINQVYNDGGTLAVKNTFAGKRFNVYAGVDKSYQSQRAETVDKLKELAEILPDGDERKDVVISALIDNLQGAGLSTIKEFNRKRMILAGYVEPDEGSPEELQLLQNLQQAQNEPDATQMLLESQAQLNLAEAEGKQAQNIERLANADKKQAETAKILQDIGLDKVKAMLDALDQQQQSFQTPA